MSTPSTTPLPELAEPDAPDSVRAIYTALRESSASPVAALIWRHIATYPGMLEQCWHALAPVCTDGRLPDAAWRATRVAATSGLLPPVSPRAQALLGITPRDADVIAAVLEAYNRANPVNLLAVLTLLARVDGKLPAATAPARSALPLAPRPPAIEVPLPRMTPPAELPEDVRWLLNDLRFGDTTSLDPVVPSLYRHLTDWPAYLAVLHTGLMPLFRDGTMIGAVKRFERAMALEAMLFARDITPVPDLAAAPGLVATMRRFAGGFIPLMIVVGRAMAEQLRSDG